MVKIKFSDGTEIEEEGASNFGYSIGKYGEMTVVLVAEDDTTLLSVHTGVRSAWKTGVAGRATAFDISSIPKKVK